MEGVKNHRNARFSQVNEQEFPLLLQAGFAGILDRMAIADDNSNVDLGH